MRKVYEGRTVMLCGNHDSDDILEIIIRGMRDEEAVKHRLLEKFDEGKIKNFEQLRHTLGTEILKHHGTSRDQQTKPLIDLTTGNIAPERQRTRRQQQSEQHQKLIRQASEDP